MISILMPIYNGIEFIEESVGTIIMQTYKEWELIIGINGHEPNSEVYEHAKRMENLSEKIRVLDIVGIKGKSNALNEMITYCKYDWVSLLDVDDKWLPKKLESQIEYMRDYDVIGTNCKYFGELNIYPKIPLKDLGNFNFKSSNPIINSSCLLKKKYAYWNDNNVEDYDLWLRLWSQGCKFYNVESVQIMHRIHKQSAFNGKKDQKDALKELLSKY